MERASLATTLLRSLPPVGLEPDEGISEALERDAELDANPDFALTIEQVDALVKERRG